MCVNGYSHHKKFNVGWAEPGMYKEFAAKIHTIRADRANRWRVGKLIHFVIKNRTPYRFQFAPVMPVLGIQEIEIRWAGEHVYINIDSRPYCTNNAIPSSEEGYQDRLMILARNDGFDSVEDFLEYFKDGFSGKIIHWTDFTYLS